jgi:hypothetical protein
VLQRTKDANVIGMAKPGRHQIESPFLISKASFVYSPSVTERTAVLDAAELAY